MSFKAVSVLCSCIYYTQAIKNILIINLAIGMYPSREKTFHQKYKLQFQSATIIKQIDREKE